MKLKPILYTALAAYAVLLSIVWLSPLAFTACSTDSLWCSFSFWITQSAGKYGTVVIILLTGIFYSLRFETIKQKLSNFFKSTLALILFLSVFAFVNEYVTKKAMRIPRPCHMYIYSRTAPTIQIDSLYCLEKDERQKILNDLIINNTNAFTGFDQKVLDHWVEEAGYSFPSGHSFNAFLLACVLSFGIMNSKRKTAKYIWFIPLCWAPIVALSRVAIGAHSALDVSFGAAMGILVAMVFLYFDNMRKLIIHKKP